MTRIAKRSFLFVVMVTFAVLCADVSAQFSGGGGMGRGMRGSNGVGDGKRVAAPTIRRNLADEVDDRLYMLEQDLRLTSEQQPLWNRYADAVQQTVRDIERDRTRNEFAEKVSLPERLDRIVEASRNRLTALEGVAAAAKAVYGLLNAQQRQTCDPRLATITALLVEVAPQAETGGQGSRR